MDTLDFQCNTFPLDHPIFSSILWPNLESSLLHAVFLGSTVHFCFRRPANEKAFHQQFAFTWKSTCKSARACVLTGHVQGPPGFPYNYTFLAYKLTLQDSKQNILSKRMQTKYLTDYYFSLPLPVTGSSERPSCHGLHTHWQLQWPQQQMQSPRHSQFQVIG